MSYKPLTLLEILDSPIKNTTLATKEIQLYSKIRAIEIDLGISEETEVSTLPKKEQEEIEGYMRQIQMIGELQVRFSRAYKYSLEKLIDANKGLPVHINAWDIHDHNIDVDNIVDTYTAVVNDEEDIPMITDGSMLDFFTDSSQPVFATAPYNVCVMQLQSPSTYDKTMGQVMTEDVLRTMRSERVAEQYGITSKEDYEKFEEQYLDLQAMNNANNSCETFAIIQHYRIDEYIDFLHLGNTYDEDRVINWGFEIKDTLVGTEVLNFGFNFDEDLGAESDLETLKDFLSSEQGKTMRFFMVVDLINKVDGEIFYESTIVNFQDEFGSPLTARKWEPVVGDTFDTELSHSDLFHITAVEKIFQWWNSDNDLLEVGGLPVTPSVRKRLKKYNKKRNNKRSITYKTLQVRPTIKVVDSEGVERAPSIREIAQHTRRGHWAHYGINGKGKLFGKYTKSIYRKPKTIGKLSSGLVLKDYELLEVKDGK